MSEFNENYCPNSMRICIQSWKDVIINFESGATEYRPEGKKCGQMYPEFLLILTVLSRFSRSEI